MKTFFVNAPESVEIKNFLWGDFYHLARTREDIRLVVFVDPQKVGEYQTIFGHERCIIESEPALRPTRAAMLFRAIALASIPTRSIWIRQEATYQNDGSLIAFLGKRVCWFLGHTFLWRAFLRRFELFFVRDDQIWKIWFEKYRPDAVFAASLKVDEDVPFLKYAKRAGVHTVGMVRSWDNFTTKTFLRVHPDALLVQNDIMQQEAMRLNDYPKKRIRVVGFAQFAHYKDAEWLLPKEDVAARIGADPHKKWVIYYTGGLPTVVLPKEVYTTQLRALTDAIECGAFGDAELLLRVHPTDPLSVDLRREVRSVQFVDFGKNFEYNRDDMRLLMNVIRLSDVVVNLGSTISLEAAVFDRPIVIAGFNDRPDSEIPKHHRMSYALDHTTHYQYVEQAGGVRRVQDADDLVRAVQEYLENPERDRAGRETIVGRLVGPLDGKTGSHVLAALEE